MTYILLIAAVMLLWFVIARPSHDRNWSVNHQRLPFAEQKDNLLTVHNIRDFSYQTGSRFTEKYIQETYNLDQIKNTWFIVSHFSKTNEGLAHTFLSFEFTDGKFLAISIEARLQDGEKYSPVVGAFRQFEMIYVAGTESDLLRLRTQIRDEKVYLYPAITTPDQSRTLLLSYIERINKIHTEPELYNTLFNNCTNQIVHHIETSLDVKFPFLSWKIFMPGHSDALAYEMELIPHDKPLSTIRKTHRVDKAVKVIEAEKEYSIAVRRGM